MAEGVKIGENYTPEGYEMTIKKESKGMSSVVIFLCIWLAGWTAGGYTAFTQFISMAGRVASTPALLVPAIFLLLWLTGWIIGEFAVIYFVLWAFAGREIIRINQGMMEISNDIFGLAWKRKFNVNAVSELGTGTKYEKAGKKSINLRGAGSISFMYEGRISRFCLVWKKSEIEYIIGMLKKHLPAGAFEKINGNE